MRTIVNSFGYRGAMDQLVVVSRFRVGVDDTEEFRSAAFTALAVLGQRPGHVGGRLARNVDEPDLWLLSTTWTNVGSYRRALSSYDVKVSGVPLLSRAIDEPSAYEQVQPGEPTNSQQARELG